MADIDWPSNIPQVFQKNSFDEAPRSGVIRTEMETGAQKVRRRFTATVTEWAGSMIMTTAELTSFRTFYKTTSAYGSLRFNFPDQFNLSGPTVEARFLVDGNPYSIRQDGETLDWEVSFTLEVFD
jgi:hypothetical protein